MNTQRNWVLALLAIAGCAMFVAAFSVLTTGTDLPEGYGKLSAADSSVKEETVPDIIGEWAQTQDGTTTIYKIAKSEFEAVLDVLRPVDPNLMRFEYQLKWDSNSKAFRGVRVVKRKGFSNPIHISLTSTIRDKGETLATKSEITAESLDVPELKEHTDELRKLYENEVDWARHPAKEAAPPQAADNVHSESVPDLTGRWTATTGGDSPDQQYNVHRIQKPGCFDAFGSINSYECRFQWNPSLKAFHVATSSRTRGIAAIEDNGNTLRIKSSMNPETLAQLMSTFDGGMPEEVVKELRKGLEDLPSDVVWTRQPVPKIAGRWISKGFADGCTIVGGRDEAFYFVYFGSKIGPKDNPDYTMKWDPETKSFEGWVNRLKSTTLGHTPILKFTVEDNENTLHVKFAYDKDTRNRVLESLKQLGMTQQEREALLDQKWARLREDAKPKAEQGNAAPILAEAPFVQIGAPDIAGEWAVSYGGGGTERYKVVPAKSKSDHFVVYATSQGMDKPFLRFQWDSKSNAFVGKLLAGVDEKLQIALRMNMTATVEPDGDAMLVTTSIDPEVLARILKKHGTEAANDASKQCEQETIWTRERMYRVKEAADQDPVPAIGGVWLMGDHGRFGKCNIVRSATEGYAFDVYTLKSVLSSNVSQSGPAYRLKWNSGAKAFEASAQLSNDPKQPGKVSVTMTVEDEGKVLNVKSTPDEAGMKSLESLKQKGIDPDDINQWLNTKWTREKENQQDWTLTDELLGAMSQAKPQGGLTGHALPQAGFGGGAIGGAGGGSAGGFGGGGGLGGGGGRQNNPNPGAGGKNSPNGAGGGDSPNNVPRVGGGAFGRLMDEDPPAAGGGRAFGRLGDEDVGHPPAGGMGLSTKKPAAPVRVESQDILLVETNDGLSAYSKSLGKWAAVKVDRPKDGTARLTRHTVGQQFAFVIIDDQLYGFSSQAAEWDRLSIPPEFFAGLKPVVGMNLLSVVVGDKTYVLSSKTGKWTASDQVPQPASFSTTISSTEIENWRQQQSGKVDSQKLAEEISEREAKAVEIAKQIRKIKSENPHASDDSLEIQKLRADLEKTLTTTFALKSKFESSRVQELQSRVGRLEQQLMRRQTQRTKIIERHLRELIDGEETDWKMEPEKEDNPQSLQTGGGFF